jgi:hypothetical protein
VLQETENTALNPPSGSPRPDEHQEGVGMVGEALAARIGYALVDAGIVGGDDLDRAIEVILDTAVGWEDVNRIRETGAAVNGHPPPSRRPGGAGGG